ncbi:hypothetical protein BO79DRAFT_54689 [Aspergillus costaricaensis CBS 115574]|uniref:Uncharacterized protein n=1 Tax=Aspergillus costaricaensis CBS 115574 TaxID=1448317 RepID=A0ACD1IRE0_9EURO|nr:hypothetical protein BO79DRAFT_54689 [Aspergillus costaricaensis CBS 115574]RAK92633.1 hypothetical protein BO79DRAFT_54689 [Aspergillus costaricaensis CBS 115574]
MSSTDPSISTSYSNQKNPFSDLQPCTSPVFIIPSNLSSFSPICLIGFPISHSSLLLNISLPFAPKNVKHRPIPTASNASRRSASCTITSSTYPSSPINSRTAGQILTLHRIRDMRDDHLDPVSKHRIRPVAKGEYARLTCAVELRLLLAI